MSSTPEIIRLIEYQPSSVSRLKLPERLAQRLVDNYGKKISLESPLFQESTDRRVTAQGWVGWIPLDSEVMIDLRPRVSLVNLFGMLEYAYRLKGFEILPGIADSDSLAEFYQSLARILASRVIDRARRGLYRSYIDYQDDLSYLRGRVNLSKAINRPHRVRLPCLFEDNTADLEDNQILAWTLRAFKPDECLQRFYNRLNSDYIPLHALCRFFLESSGPTHERGERKTLPFLVDMGNLFELFVAEWLKAHVPSEIQVDIQDSIKVGEEHTFEFVIDISLSDSITGRCLAVIDTKYKIDSKPKNEDIYQVVAYAEAKSTNRAILVYPQVLDQPTVGSIGKVHVHTISFCIDAEIESAGEEFISRLLKLIS